MSEDLAKLNYLFIADNPYVKLVCIISIVAPVELTKCQILSFSPKLQVTLGYLKPTYE